MNEQHRDLAEDDLHSPDQTVGTILATPTAAMRTKTVAPSEGEELQPMRSAQIPNVNQRVINEYYLELRSCLEETRPVAQEDRSPSLWKQLVSCFRHGRRHSEARKVIGQVVAFSKLSVKVTDEHHLNYLQAVLTLLNLGKLEDINMSKSVTVLTRSLGYANSLANTIAKPGALLALFFILYMHERSRPDLLGILKTCTAPESQFPLLPAAIKISQIMIELLVVHQVDIFGLDTANCLKKICMFFTGLFVEWTHLFRDFDLSLEHSAQATRELVKQARKHPMAYLREPSRLI